MILASKNWGNDTFDEDGYTIDSAGVEITGLAKKITDHDILSEITDVLDQVDEGIDISCRANKQFRLKLQEKRIYAVSICSTDSDFEHCRCCLS